MKLRKASSIPYPLLAALVSFLLTIVLLYKPTPIDMNVVRDFAHSANPLALAIAEMRLRAGGWGHMPAFLWLGMLLLLLWRGDRRSSAPAPVVYRLCALLFSVFMTVGKALLHNGGVATLYGTLFQFLLTALSLVGYYLLFSILLPLLERGLAALAQPCQELGGESAGRLEKVFAALDAHPFLGTFLLMLAVEVPYYIIFYPGTAMADALQQLTMYYGPNVLSNHHPVLSTLLMGGLNDLGRMVGDNNFGLFFYIFLQSLAQFATFSLTFVLAKKHRLNHRARLGVLLFFLLFPAIRVFAITMVKNTTFYICYYLFTLASVGYWLDDEHQGRWLVGVFLSAVLTWMFLNTGFYVVLIGLAVLLLKKAGALSRIKVCSVILAILMINTGYHQFFLPAIGCAEGYMRETLSILTQQTARYCALHTADITPREREVMGRVFYCSPEELGEKYDPELSNNSKESFLVNPSPDDLKDYLTEVWWPQLLSHPVTYIDAALIQGYGYWFPDREVFDGISYYDIPSFVLSEEENAHLQFSRSDTFETARRAIRWTHETISKSPGLGYLYSCGIYTWAILFLCAVLIAHKRFRECALALPILANVGINCISPVNAYFRYQVSVAVVAPIFLIFVLLVLREASNQQAQKKES